jgi:hypothetical protein
MDKKVLSEISLYYGDILMPEGFEINQEVLTNNILQSSFKDNTLLFSKEFDKLTTYVKEHVNLYYNLKLREKDIWGNIYKPNESDFILQNIKYEDLKNSPDFNLLYGVKTENCIIKIHYNDNRRKGKIWEIPLTTNKFIMFPTTCLYRINNNQKNSLNFIQTITYDFI